MDSRINRRQFLAKGSVTLGGLAVSSRFQSAAPTMPHSHIPSGVGEFRVPLPIQKVLCPVLSDSSADYYELTQEEAWIEIIPGLHTQVWGYNGTFPGPTIKARRERR